MPTPTFASPDDLPRPAGFSQVVAIPPGALVWTSGQIGSEPDGSTPFEPASAAAADAARPVLPGSPAHVSTGPTA